MSTDLTNGMALPGTDESSADGYSLFPVHAWSHNVSDVVAVAKGLEGTGYFEVVTPSALLKAVAQNVRPPDAR